MDLELRETARAAAFTNQIPAFAAAPDVYRQRLYAQVFPRAGQSLRPAGLVWTKVPNVIDAFERGALIRAEGGRKFLAIPTGFNAARGHRGRGCW